MKGHSDIEKWSSYQRFCMFLPGGDTGLHFLSFLLFLHEQGHLLRDPELNH